MSSRLAGKKTVVDVAIVSCCSNVVLWPPFSFPVLSGILTPIGADKARSRNTSSDTEYIL